MTTGWTDLYCMAASKLNGTDRHHACHKRTRFGSRARVCSRLSVTAVTLALNSVTPMATELTATATAVFSRPSSISSRLLLLAFCDHLLAEWIKDICTAYSFIPTNPKRKPGASHGESPAVIICFGRALAEAAICYLGGHCSNAVSEGKFDSPFIECSSLFTENTFSSCPSPSASYAN